MYPGGVIHVERKDIISTKCVGKIGGEMETVNTDEILCNDNDTIEKICGSAFIAVQDIPAHIQSF